MGIGRSIIDPPINNRSMLSWDGHIFNTMTLTTPDAIERKVTEDVLKLLTEKQWNRLYGLTELPITQALANEIIHKATATN
jgi:hypothetical protein